MTFTFDSDVLFALRCGSGPFRVDCPYLTEAEREVLSESFSAYSARLFRLLRRHYGSRASGAEVAAEWGLSESYTEAIVSIVSGDLRIPTTIRDWWAIARTVAPRYWRTLSPITIDHTEVDRLIVERLSEPSSSEGLRSFVEDCLTYAGKVGPRIREYAEAYVSQPGATSAELAEILSTSTSNVRALRCRFLSAMRAGCIGLLVATSA